MTDTIQTAPKRFQCRHIHTEGRRCGSASLRGEEFCYFHHTSRKPVANPRDRRSRQSTFDLPLPEDRGAIQLSLGEVLRRIAANAIDPRRAGLLLYGLQIAALNLPPHRPANTRREPETDVVEEIVIHPTHGDLAPACELPGPDDPREGSLTALLLRELRKGHEEIERECRAKFEAELQQAVAAQADGQTETEAEPITLPALNAAEATNPASPAVIPSEAEKPASRTSLPLPLPLLLLLLLLLPLPLPLPLLLPLFLLLLLLFCLSFPKGICCCRCFCLFLCL